MRNPRVFLGLAAGIVLLRAQAPPAPGNPGVDATFHAGTQEVIVDATVTDKKGNVPRDLTQKNFKILEDRREQQITSFSRESMGGTGHSKHFVALLFESDDAKFRDAALRFVDDVADPDLYVAIYARKNKKIELQQGFTADSARIRAALKNMRVAELTLTLAESTEEERRNTHLAQIGELATTFAAIRGRKALVEFGWDISYVRRLENGGAARTANGGWVKPPWPPPIVPQLDEAVSICNQSDVSVYGFELVAHATSMGDYAYRPPRPEDDHGATLNVMQDLAARTSGRYSVATLDNLASYLNSVAADQDDAYLLGYVPPAASVDKPCHKLKVTVDRKGLDVNARESYCTSDGSGAPETKPQQALETRMANAAAGTVKARLQLPWFYSKASLPLVEVAMDIDPSAMKVKGKLRGEIDVAGIAYRQDGSVATRIGDAIHLEFETQAQMDAFGKTPFHYSKEFSVPPGRYDVRLAVGSGDQAFGSVGKSLEIDPWGGQTLAVSALALSDDDGPSPALTAELDNSAMEGPHRLGSLGRELVPMGGTEFHKNGLGFFYFEVYEPRLSQATTATPVKAPAMWIRVLDHATGQEKANSGPMDAGAWMQLGNPVIPIALTLPMATLPAGSYTLEVRVTHDDGQDAVVRTADFEVK